MMPLALAQIGEENVVKRVGGNPDIRKRLEDLGFVPGGRVTVVSSLNGNIIVNVKETRIAVDEAMAMKIMV